MRRIFTDLVFGPALWYAGHPDVAPPIFAFRTIACHGSDQSGPFDLALVPLGVPAHAPLGVDWWLGLGAFKMEFSIPVFDGSFLYLETRMLEILLGPTGLV